MNGRKEVGAVVKSGLDSVQAVEMDHVLNRIFGGGHLAACNTETAGIFCVKVVSNTLSRTTFYAMQAAADAWFEGMEFGRNRMLSDDEIERPEPDLHMTGSELLTEGPIVEKLTSNLRAYLGWTRSQRIEIVGAMQDTDSNLYAVRAKLGAKRDEKTGDFLIPLDDTVAEIEEVEFESWPPTMGEWVDKTA